MGLIPGSGRSPGGGNGNPLQYSCLENSMDREAWWATVHGVIKSGTRLKQLSMHASQEDPPLLRSCQRKQVVRWISGLERLERLLVKSNKDFRERIFASLVHFLIMQHLPWYVTVDKYSLKGWVQSLDQEDPLEEGTASHSSFHAWRISWTEEPVRLLSLGSQRVGHD